MHPNEQLLRSLFQAIDAHKVNDVVDCYTENATFEDIAFRLENKKQIRAMWEMLFKPEVNDRRCDLRVEVKEVTADDAAGRAAIVDSYTYRDKLRPVINRIESTFQFRDGKISKHIDKCDAICWARQAIGGFEGFIAGHVEFIRRRKAMGKLKSEHREAFM